MGDGTRVLVWLWYLAKGKEGFLCKTTAIMIYFPFILAQFLLPLIIIITISKATKHNQT
jgi:preprotein translocase subunit SecG